MAEKKIPDPMDVHVGSRVRVRRTMRGMSQEKLGEALGVSFQQIQKYEKGMNKIGSSRMHLICKALDTPVGFFYEDAPGSENDNDAGRRPGFEDGNSSSFVLDFVSSAEGIQLNRHFARITSKVLRKQVIDMVKTLADETGAPPLD